MRNAGNTSVYYFSMPIFILRCMYMAILLQFAGAILFAHPPKAEAIYELLTYAFGVTSGCITAMATLRRFAYLSGPSQAYTQTIHLTERYIIILSLISILPILPDAISSLWLSQEQTNVRYVLLNDPGMRIVHPKILMIFGKILTVIATYYIIFYTEKSLKGTLFVLFLLALNSLVYASRTDFIVLLFFLILASPKVISFKRILGGLLFVFLMGLYTIYVQGRAETRSLDHFFEVVCYYTVYFGYPLYLASSVSSVFGNISIAYSIFGYPADVIETYLSSTGEIANQLNNIAFYSYIGFDRFGQEHFNANVLYPQYAIICHTLGLLGIFIFFSLISFGICMAAEVKKSWIYFWRVLAFLLFFETARMIALGLPGTWLQLIFTFIFTYFLNRNIREQRLPC